jgi:subtilase family serine protease
MLGSRKKFRFQDDPSPRRNLPAVEELEARTLLSTTLLSSPPASLVTHVIYPSVSVDVSSVTNPSKAPLTPNVLREAYGVNLLQFPSGGGYVAGNGAGETIAIADAYNDPTIAADLQTFDSTFALPNPPSFTVLNENGGTDLSGVANSPKSSWALEESLDVEWAHTFAPGANIVLFEANSANNIDLDIADQTAANPATYTPLGITPAGVVSNSFGSTEGSNPSLDETQADEEYEDTNYFQPISEEGTVTVVAAAGDYGNQSYPAVSPYVLSVGGTTLTLKTSPFGVSYSSETAWTIARSRSSPTGEEGTGGGISLYEPEPTYQTNAGISTGGFRATPDVSEDANPSSGVYITDTYDFPGDTAVGSIGGTSLATPLWAALLTDVNQGRALLGEGVLANAQEAVYNVPSTDFHDITSGHNIVATAGTGYDEVTGIGTPIANKLVPDLVNTTTGPVVVPGAVEYNDSQGIPANLTANVAVNDAGHGAPITNEAMLTSASISMSESAVASGSQSLRTISANTATISLPPTGQVFRTDSEVTTTYGQAAIAESFHGSTDAVLAATDTETTPTEAGIPSMAGDNVDANSDSATVPPLAPLADNASDAVFAGYASQAETGAFVSAPAAVALGDQSQPVDLAMVAGLALALGGSWSTLARAEETRKYPALRD